VPKTVSDKEEREEANLTKDALDCTLTVTSVDSQQLSGRQSYVTHWLQIAVNNAIVQPRTLLIVLGAAVAVFSEILHLKT